MLFLQHHFRVITQDFINIGRVIFGDQRQQYALALQRGKFLLHAPVNISRIFVGAKFNAVQQVLTDHTAPKGIIAVQRQYLVEMRPKAACSCSDATRQFVHIRARVGGFVPEVKAMIERCLLPDCTNNVFRIDDTNIDECRSFFAQCRVKPIQYVGNCILA